MKFHENPISWSRDGRTDSQTDKHNEENSRFSLFCERAEKWVCRLWLHSHKHIFLGFAPKIFD